VPIYRPRMYATLTVPILGTRAQRIQQEKSDEEITLGLRPISLTHERNDHNTADACSLTLDWTDAGVDPRLLSDGVLTVYVGQADELGNWTPNGEDVRFIGMLLENSADRRVDQAGTVSIDAVDYTSLFLDAKPFGSSGIPDYSQTLPDAWARICSQTPGAEHLADSIVFEEVSRNLRIGDAVSDRFRRLGQVPTKPETDAWAVWQQCVGMLGLVSFFRLDAVVVTTTTALYTEGDPPVMIWGRNITTWRESRNATAAQKAIGVTSFDPLTGTTLEAFYPPIGDPRVKHKGASAKALAQLGAAIEKKDKALTAGQKTATSKRLRRAAAAVRQNEDREYMSIPGITSQEALDDICQRVWEERRRQELSGYIETGEMSVETASGAELDLLALGSGDAIKVQIDQETRELLATFVGAPRKQIAHLVERGYSEEAAQLIVANYQEFAEIEPVYHVQTVTTNMEVQPDGGSFSVGVDYVNRIQVAQ
jgi:hypothetical protein